LSSWATVYSFVVTSGSRYANLFCRLENGDDAGESP
jgi:hypothetical protein